jgi:hypothetical protein
MSSPASPSAKSSQRRRCSGQVLAFNNSKQEEEAPPSPTTLSQSRPPAAASPRNSKSDDATNGSARTKMVILAHIRAVRGTRISGQTQTSTGVRIPSSPSPSPSPHPPGDLCTAPTSFVTAPVTPTIVSRTRGSGGDARTREFYLKFIQSYSTPEPSWNVPFPFLFLHAVNFSRNGSGFSPSRTATRQYSRRLLTD